MNDLTPSTDACAAVVERKSPKACGYGRVSTARQAEGELSLPEQRDAIARHCATRTWELVDYYVDAGVSGTEEDRPEFQRMIERALDDDRPFDLVVVHSLSRFFRDSFHLEMYVRKLAKAGVRVVSVTQELGEDPAQVMMRQLIAMFDEYQSRENAKHVLRAMNENARQGFYNGSPMPLGYRTEEVERRGARIKKRLVVDPVEAELVKLIFRLCRLGDAMSGPMGVKAIACWLNARGHRTRTGGLFGNGAVHTILTNLRLCRQMDFQQALVEDAAPEADRRANRRRRAGDHRHERIRGGQQVAQEPRSALDRTTDCHRADPPHWLGSLRRLRRRHDSAHWHLEIGRRPSLLRMLDLRAAGQDGVPRPLDSDG